MLDLFLWPVMAVWMGLAFVVGGTIVGTIAWCTMHMLRDVLVGQAGKIWCPSAQREMVVHGTPTHSTVGLPFAALSRCERWGNGAIICSKSCLLRTALLARPA